MKHYNAILEGGENQGPNAPGIFDQYAGTVAEGGLGDLTQRLVAIDVSDGANQRLITTAVDPDVMRVIQRLPVLSWNWGNYSPWGNRLQTVHTNIDLTQYIGGTARFTWANGAGDRTGTITHAIQHGSVRYGARKWFVYIDPASWVITGTSTRTGEPPATGTNTSITLMNEFIVNGHLEVVQLNP